MLALSYLCKILCLPVTTVNSLLGLLVKKMELQHCSSWAVNSGVQRTALVSVAHYMSGLGIVYQACIAADTITVL